MGRPAVVACYAGAVEYGHKVLRPLKTFGSPVLDMAGFGKQITSSITSFALWQIGGAVAHVGESETAFNGLQHRA